MPDLLANACLRAGDNRVGWTDAQVFDVEGPVVLATQLLVLRTT